MSALHARLLEDSAAARKRGGFVQFHPDHAEALAAEFVALMTAQNRTLADLIEARTRIAAGGAGVQG